MRVSKPFVVFKRQLPSGKSVYYYTARLADGRRAPGRSTGQTTKNAAERYCAELFRQGNLIPKAIPLFRDYTAEWWDYDRCSYVKRMLRTRGRFSPSYAHYQRVALKKYIKPTFDKMLLSDITTGDIEHWRTTLVDMHGLSNLTANHILANLKVILREAFRCQIIDRDPASPVSLYKPDSQEKGILTIEEARKLFKDNDHIAIWGEDDIHPTINLLAMLGGLRQGEILALKTSDIRSEGVQVNNSWDKYKKKLVLPKNGKSRFVPLPDLVLVGLRSFGKANGSKTKEGFLFPNKDLDGPIDHKVINHHLYRAFRMIGITEEERRTRNISFHSWRHFATSQMRTSVGDHLARLIIGHSDVAMQDHYSHPTDENAAMIRQAQLRLLKPTACALFTL